MDRKIKKIKEAIRNDFKVKRSDSWQKVDLTEDNRASCKSVFLNETGVKSVIIDLDKQGEDIHPLFTTEQGTTGLKVKNDYMIFALKNSKLYVLLIEMKSKNSGNWIKQCKAGEIVAKYIIQMVNNWVDDLVLDINNFHFRYILFKTSNVYDSTSGNVMKKRKTKAGSLKYKIHPEGFEYIVKPCNNEYSIGIFCK